MVGSAELSSGSRPTCHRPRHGAGDQSGTRSSPNHAVVGAALHAWSAHGLHELGLLLGRGQMSANGTSESSAGLSRRQFLTGATVTAAAVVLPTVGTTPSATASALSPSPGRF